METLEQYLASRRADVETALNRYLPTSFDCPAVLAEAIRYSVLAGGKRLRPILTVTCAEAIAAKRGTNGLEARDRALPAACAIEMIHTYSLIHDDLPAMDDDVLRRGRPTAHVVFGEGMAILAGDGLHAEAFKLLARYPDTRQHPDPDLIERKLLTIEFIADAVGAGGMVGGQAIDLEAVRPGPARAQAVLDAKALEDMHGRKTGALIRASALAGATMGGGDGDDLAPIDAYAREIGLAFQIVDDILDVEAASVDLGKTAGKDAAAGKPTYPSLFGLDQSKALAARCLERARAHVTAGGLTNSRLIEIADWVVQRRS